MRLKTKCLLILVFLAAGYVQAQPYKALRVGDTIPDIPLGKAYLTGISTPRFSQLTGKLILLDFWDSSCISCIQAFPKMDKLQHEFGDRIQVFLVNTLEDSLAIDKRRSLPTLKDVHIFPDQVVYEAAALQQLFPHHSVPHHVWIDANRVVRLIGSPLNSNPEKIRRFLRGDHISFLKNDNNTRPLSAKESLSGLLDLPYITRQDSGYLCTGHNNEFSPTSAQIFQGISQANHQIRETYLNMEVAELYKQVFWPEIHEQEEKMIYSGLFSYGTSLNWLDYVWIDHADTLQLTTGFKPFTDMTDLEFTGCRYSYEQVLPATSTSLERRHFMLERLNEQFGGLLGIEGMLVKRSVPCYVLKYHPENKQVTTGEGSGKQYPSVKQALQYLVFNLFAADPSKYRPFMLDETGVKNISGLELPDYNQPYTFKDIASALRKAGITMLKEKRKLKFVLIRGYKKSAGSRLGTGAFND